MYELKNIKNVLSCQALIKKHEVALKIILIKPFDLTAKRLEDETQFGPRYRSSNVYDGEC